MSERVLIIGAGGHARALIPLLGTNGLVAEGIYDDSFKGGQEEEWILGLPVCGSIRTALEERSEACVLGIGENSKRRELFERFADRCFRRNLIAPSATISSDVHLDDSGQIMPNTTINAGVKAGKNVLFNTGSIVEHEVLVGDHAHVSVGAILCGRVELGMRCFVGAGAVIVDKVRVVDDVVIGAGAVVTQDITEAGVYVGTPAERIS